MKLAALFSGGKDSTFSIYKAKQDHEISCLITLSPVSDESHLLHYPNIKLTQLQSESMGIPQIFEEANSLNTDNEVSSLIDIIKKAKEEYHIEGLLHGGILSEFQKKHFEKICDSLGLELISPVWHKNPNEYMNNLLESKFNFIIISVSSDGLTESWLGKQISPDNLKELEKLSKKFGFNLNFEGGEAETLVIDCPLFSYPIKINKAKKIWDGYRGRFEIEDANLDYNAR